MPKAEELGRQAHHVHQPVHQVGFQLGAGRAGQPQHPLDTQTRREQFAQDGRSGRIAWKEGVKIGRLPMGNTRQDDAFHVREHGVEGLTLKGGPGGQGGANVAGPDLGQDRQGLSPLAVSGDPVDEGIAGPAEFVG
jgi:hypothetical protein